MGVKVKSALAIRHLEIGLAGALAQNPQPSPAMKTHGPAVTRRHFIKSAAAAIAAPGIVPAKVLGLDGATAPSNKTTMAVFGWGMQGPGNTSQFLAMGEVQVVASCNVDQKHLEASLNRINEHYKNKDCKAYKDFREAMARADIDAVMLALPDNWHALVAVEAAKNKKDIYGEKPLARTIREQQAIVKAVKDNGRIFQTGSQQRSSEEFHKACELVRNGMIGKISAVEVGLPGGHHDFAGTGKETAVTDPPPHLDYDFWTGPSQMEPYIKARHHMNWRWNYNVGGGQLLDWIGHHCDIAHWGMGWDESGPSEVKPIQCDFPPKDAMWNTATKYRAELTYAGGVKMTIAGGHSDIGGGTKFIGTDGWIWVNRGQFESSNPEFRRFSRLPEDKRKVALFKSPGHHRNFIDSVRSRQPALCTAQIGHRSAVPGHFCSFPS